MNFSRKESRPTYLLYLTLEGMAYNRSNVSLLMFCSREQQEGDNSERSILDFYPGGQTGKGDLSIFSSMIFHVMLMYYMMIDY